MTETSDRQYSPAEIAAARLVLKTIDGGPLHFAGGDWWPTKLEADAKLFERKAVAARLVAAAMRREIAADPITGPGVRALAGNEPGGKT